MYKCIYMYIIYIYEYALSVLLVDFLTSLFVASRLLFNFPLCQTTSVVNTFFFTALANNNINKVPSYGIMVFFTKNTIFTYTFVLLFE